MSDTQLYPFNEKLLFHGYVMQGVVNAINELTNSNMKVSDRIRYDKDNNFIAGLILLSSLYVLGIDQACDNNIQEIALCDERRNNYSHRTLNSTITEKINNDIRNSLAHGDWGINSFCDPDNHNEQTLAFALDLNNHYNTPIIIRFSDLKNHISSFINLNKDKRDLIDFIEKRNGGEKHFSAYDKINRCQLSKDLLCISDYYLNNRKFKFKDLEEEQSFKKDIYNSDTLELLVLLAPLSMFTISTQSDYRTAGIYNSTFWFYDKDNFDVIRDSFAHGSFYKYGNRNIYFRDYYQSRSGEVTDRHISINRNDIVNFLDELTKMARNYISNHLDDSNQKS